MLKIRTSATHPLEIAEIRAGPEMGRIGVTFCPGKRQSSALSGAWERDLEADIDAIEDWGAAAVVTLLEPSELRQLDVAGLESAVADRFMTWFHLPIADVDIPGRTFERAWKREGESIRSLLRCGFDVLIHCKGGLGRSGTIAARLLVELGWISTEAISAVRRARPGAIETPAQERHVRRQGAVDVPLRDSSEDAVTDRALGALLGLAVGDAVGTTLEFKKRDSYTRLTDMIGGGPFRLKAGEWTDDTAMALALADSLIERRGLDERDVMDRFVSWWRRGRYSCTGRCFDIGITTSQALGDFERTGNPIAGSTHSKTAGNGSLMRLAPVTVFGMGAAGEVGSVEIARRQSATTHGAPACLDACEWFSLILYLAIAGKSRHYVFLPHGSSDDPDIARVLSGSWRGKKRGQIQSSGYVAHTLEAALWCVARTNSFKDAVLLAANLGDDADTTAAVTGQLAGALYGKRGIPAAWLSKLAWSDRMERMGRDLLAAGRAAAAG